MRPTPETNEPQVDHNTTADNDMIWTGCKHNGTEVFYAGTSRALGTSSVQAGKLNRTSQSQGPLESSELITNNANRPMYGLSDLFRVVAADSNNPPVFTDGATQTRSFAEAEGDTAAVSEVTIGDPFTATDSDTDALAYTLGGTDAGSFTFDTGTGQIKQKTGEIYDYEAKSAYSVTVTVHDGTASVTADVTINLTDVSEAPVQMAMPTVTPRSGSTSALDVNWVAPPNEGRPPITEYWLQYQESGDPTTLLSASRVSGMFTNTTIAGLEPGTAYEVQVRAVNDDGDGAWSPFGEGTTTLPSLGPRMTVQDGSDGEDSNFIHFQIHFSETLTENIFFDYTTSIESSDTAEANDFDAESATGYRVQSGSDYAGITVEPNDDDIYEGDETFTITFSNLVNVHAIGNGATATGTIIDNETQPTLDVSPASATEGDPITFTVDLIGPLTEDDVTFDYATSRSGDNSEADDFTATSGTGTITAGSTTTTFTVPTHDDGTNQVGSIYEGDETFTVTISNPTIAGISQATAKGTILDDERFPRVSFASNNLLVSEQAGDVSNFISFNIVPASENPEQVSLLITGTATSGDDYSPQSDTVDFPRLASQQGRIITIIDDSQFEIEETVIITMVGASNDTQIELTDITRTLIITDNDDPPVLSFDETEITVNEDAGPVVLTVNKVGLTQVTATVDYETRQRTGLTVAVEGDDYIATSGTLTFQPNETSKTISVPIINDNVYEEFPERFDVFLENPSHADRPSNPYAAGVSIASEDPEPRASMANVTASEPTGTMTLTLKLNRPSQADISYVTNNNDQYRSGTATIEDDYQISYAESDSAFITVRAGQLTGTFDITLIEDDLEEPDETVELRWQKRTASMATPDEINFVGTITDDADRPRGPTNLTATPDGTNEIDLTWQAPTDIGTSDISGYKIQSSPNGTSNWTDLVPNTHRTITNYSDSGLSPGTNRYYRIRAINASGAGSASNIASATTADKTVSFGAAQYTASENGATARVTVELSAAVDVTIPIRIQHRNGASSADYSGVPRRLIFEHGTTITLVHRHGSRRLR